MPTPKPSPKPTPGKGKTKTGPGGKGYDKVKPVMPKNAKDKIKNVPPVLKGKYKKNLGKAGM